MTSLPSTPSRGFTAMASLALGAALLLTGCDNVGGDGDSSDERAATVQVSPTSAPDSDVSGTVEIVATDAGALRLTGTLEGLSPGDHGLHLHATGDCSAADSDGDGTPEPAGAAGSHYDADPGPDEAHGAPSDAPQDRHFGDFGNVTAGDDGTADVNVAVQRPEGIQFDTDVLGRALLVHEGRDDLETDPAGASGTRFGCGIAMEASDGAY